ncbi:GntR family transcriptional regulator [Catenulispora sp. GP43]|uniref:GntR family transcriptional regulator n=1 Tax=Catenulispora sp. GP43 TaxID=3156263 RepID=UPI00351958E2
MGIDKQVSEDQGSPIEFRLDPGSGVPVYLQLVHQVEHALRLGYLEPGDRLPKVKDVVAGLAINPNTVLKAYRDLEHKGLAVGRPGQGTFIEGTLGTTPLREQQALHRALTAWMRSADQAGLDEDGMVALFTSALHDFRAGKTGQTGQTRTTGTSKAVAS